VVFLGLGFETTMPSTALTVLEADRDGIGNFRSSATTSRSCRR
jgi:hydrogenase expression/formation protein HypD